MPLDTGAVTDSLVMSPGVGVSDVEDRLEQTPSRASHVGALLRATREGLGRSVQDIADATRIKRAYLEAVEELRLEDLPSRPFTIGYVRAYARALGLDEYAAVEQFKMDCPAADESLHAPVGVGKHGDARMSLLAGAGAVVVTAVLIWNLAQHAMANDAPAPSAVVESSSPAPGPAATVAVSAAQPAPIESTNPAPYQTPGLDSVSGSPAASAAAKQNAAAAAEAAMVASEATPFHNFAPHGAVYGVPASPSTVILQARKSVSLVVRSSDGQVHFAQVLKAGEAYRAPLGADLTLDVSDTAALRVYVAGQLHPDLPAPVSPLNKLAVATPDKPTAAG